MTTVPSGRHKRVTPLRRGCCHAHRRPGAAKPRRPTHVVGARAADPVARRPDPPQPGMQQTSSTTWGPAMAAASPCPRVDQGSARPDSGHGRPLGEGNQGQLVAWPIWVLEQRGGRRWRKENVPAPLGASTGRRHHAPPSPADGGSSGLAGHWAGSRGASTAVRFALASPEGDDARAERSPLPPFVLFKK